MIAGAARSTAPIINFCIRDPASGLYLRNREQGIRQGRRKKRSARRDFITAIFLSALSRHENLKPS
jgi:hypothetical protein